MTILLITEFQLDCSKAFCLFHSFTQVAPGPVIALQMQNRGLKHHSFIRVSVDNEVAANVQDYLLFLEDSYTEWTCKQTGNQFNMIYKGSWQHFLAE